MSSYQAGGRNMPWRSLCGMLLLAGAPAAWCAPPIQPLPAPMYSFDLMSPTVIAGIVSAGDVLTWGSPYPTVVIPGTDLGLWSPYDHVDALSGHNADVLPTESFALLFSVDRQTVGAAAPDPQLVALGVPYTVLDQAAHGQAAGDQFMSMQLFARGGQRSGERPGAAVLTRNNYDEGGTDCAAQPATAAPDDAGGAPQDNVTGMGSLPSGARSRIMNVYFSLSAQSPSLQTLPGSLEPSGAHIFFNPNPLNLAPTTLYAEFWQLGLSPFDDIDAMIVFDTNVNGVFDGNDEVLLSLTPGSPSLNSIPGHSLVAAAADVFRCRAGFAPALYGSAAALGLGNSADNIDGLGFCRCNDVVICAGLHGIRLPRPGDLNCDGLVNGQDIDHFVEALFNAGRYVDEHDGDPYLPCDILNGDFNGDGVVNGLDIDGFVAVLFGH